MANLLTAIRLLLVIPVAMALANASLFSNWLLLVLIVIAIASDYFDGKVARDNRSVLAVCAGLLLSVQTEAIKNELSGALERHFLFCTNRTRCRFQAPSFRTSPKQFQSDDCLL